MIGKRGRLLILLYMVLLLVLFLMCSTDLIIREPEKEIYQVAVIIEDVRDDQYSNFRKGMDQAAVEFNADVRFITLYERLDAEHQMELIDREQQDGVDALIIVPVDEAMVEEALEEKQVSVPTVLLSASRTENRAAGTIVTDYQKMGQELAERALAGAEKDCPVILLKDPVNSGTAGRLFLDGMEQVLASGGREVQSVLCERNRWGGALEELCASCGQQVVILAENPEILAEAAGALADNASLRDCVQGLYGRGSTMAVLNELDRGLITGICVTDEFSRGYSSVRMAVEAQEGLRSPETEEAAFCYIEREDLREPGYEAMLYPIE